MKWSFAAGGMFILGIIGVAAIILFQKLTTSNENDYYLLKEIAEAAMYDSIDLSYYEDTGHVKIVKEKFVENFTRRYAQSTLFIGTKYIISFYDIIEEPPKVSIIINTGIDNYRIYDDKTTANYNVQNYLTGILEYTGSKEESENISNSTYGESLNGLYKTKELEQTYYSSVSVQSDKIVGATQPINIPNELTQLEIKNIKIKRVTAEPTTELGEILKAKLQRELDWKSAEEDPTNYYEYIDTDETASTINNFNFYYYNCKEITEQKNGYARILKDSDMNCEKYNNFWIHWNGTTDSGSKMYLRLKIVWEYDEYEY